jgi:hypothetical protein
MSQAMKIDDGEKLDQLCINTIRNACNGRACSKRTPVTRGHRWQLATGGLCFVGSLPSSQSTQPAMAEPRSFRAFSRTCLDVGLFHASPVAI